MLIVYLFDPVATFNKDIITVQYILYTHSELIT